MRDLGHRMVDDLMDYLATQEILIRLQEQGIAAPTSTTLHGKFAIRAANVNHRSRRADFAALAEAVVRIGDELTSSALV